MQVEIAPRIVVDPQVQHGKPVIKGTCVPVHLLLGHLSGGMSMQEIADAYAITVEDIRAALGYAEHVIARKRTRRTG